ncbi:MAG: hypothetical protein S4CHLAM81_15450 [Chlamydiales bacterium]|nr:hypothetical protein [Chlamydiales bacterium]
MRRPGNPGAWGAAAVDIGLLGFSTTKIGNIAKLGMGRSVSQVVKQTAVPAELSLVQRTIRGNISPSPCTPVGHRGKRINVLDGTNTQGIVRSFEYSGHAFDRMQSQGINPSIVENAVKTGHHMRGKVPGTTVYHDNVNNLTVVTNEVTGRIITVDFGIIKQNIK